MHAHPMLLPGRFKDRKNCVGSTTFVLPELVSGTIEQGLAFLPTLPAGVCKALFLKLFLVEIYPFLDGNGRIARILMNQKLTANGDIPIIIPSIYRIDYMGGVKAMTKQTNTATYIKMMSRAQEFSATIPFQDYRQMMSYLHDRNAFSDDPNDVLRF